MTFIPPPRDLILKFLGWLDREVYPGLHANYPTAIPARLDWEGVAAWGCDRFVTLWQEPTTDPPLVRYENIRHQIFSEIWAVLNPPPVPTTPLRALSGQVQVSGQWFRDALGPVTPLGLHLGWGLGMLLYGQEARLRQILEAARTAGYQSIRTFMTLGYWPTWQGFEVGPDDFINANGIAVQGQRNYFASVVQYLSILREYNLKLDASFGDMQRFTYPAAFLNEFGLTVRDSGLSDVLMLFQVNEPWQNFPIPADPSTIRGALRGMADRLPGVLWGIGASTSEELTDMEAWREGVPLAVVHEERDPAEEAHRTLSHTFSLGYAARQLMPRVLSEPMGFGTSVGSYSTTPVIGLHAALAIATGHPWNFVTSGGIWPRGRDGWPDDPQDYPAFREIPRLIAQLPPPMWGGTVTHGGTSQAVLISRTGYYNPPAVTIGPRRVDQVYDPIRVVAFVYGVEERRVRLESRRPFSRVRLWSGAGELRWDSHELPAEFFEPRLVLMES